MLLTVCVVKYLTSRSAASFGTEAAERVKLALRERLYRKMLAMGPSYASRVRTADVVQSAGEGIDQIQSFFELFLPQLFYAVLAPVTLFAVLMPVNIPAAVVLLACGPADRAGGGRGGDERRPRVQAVLGQIYGYGRRVPGQYAGLETLKAFDADERAAADMDEKAEAFRVMTMQVLQIQLRSLTAMDAVAYGGTAAGIGVAVWQFLVGGVDMAGAMIVVFLSASFFLPLRQLGSYFHVAMNGMTSTKRIFALLDAPSLSAAMPTLPGGGRDLTVTFNAVAYRYADADAVDGSVGADGSVNADSDTSRLPSISPIPPIRTLTHLGPPSMPPMPPMWTPTYRWHPLPPSPGGRLIHCPPGYADRHCRRIRLRQVDDRRVAGGHTGRIRGVDHVVLRCGVGRHGSRCRGTARSERGRDDLRGVPGLIAQPPVSRARCVRTC